MKSPRRAQSPQTRRARFDALLMIVCLLVVVAGCGSHQQVPENTLEVNSLEDPAQPPTGTLTLRAALAQAGPRDRITFSPSLSGQTIQLSIVGESHTVLKGEVYSGMTYLGYQERDYGASALYARKNVTLDASDLPAGITIAWTGGDGNPARVLAVWGNLTMTNVAVTGGYSKTVAIPTGQAYTLARGGGLAVWGYANLENCAIVGNRVSGDENSSRDRGTYGGGIYANGLMLTNSMVSGNSAIGYGAAGGGIYSVGGADNNTGAGNEAFITGSIISGNRVTGQHAYGGGVFTLAGGPDNRAWLRVTNSTIARNRVEDHPNLPEAGQYYYRGGGIYMGGGSLEVISSTVVENEVAGPLAMFSGKPNIGGGGIAGTIGNAHVIEDVLVRHSIVAGNSVNGATQDWYTGSLLSFQSGGYNRFGALDFSQILVPIPDWMYLSRRHYPKIGDQDGVALPDIVDLSQVERDPAVVSAGTDAGQPIVLWYPPKGNAVDVVPTGTYTVTRVDAGYTGWGDSTDDFLNHAVEKVRTNYGSILGSDFGSSYGDLTGTTWYGPAMTWPANPQNANWITFWHTLETDIGDRLGPAPLNDTFWVTFSNGRLGNVNMTVTQSDVAVRLVTVDQRGRARTGMGDVGAIER